MECCNMIGRLWVESCDQQLTLIWSADTVEILSCCVQGVWGGVVEGEEEEEGIGWEGERRKQGGREEKEEKRKKGRVMKARGVRIWERGQVMHGSNVWCCLVNSDTVMSCTPLSNTD